MKNNTTCPICAESALPDDLAKKMLALDQASGNFSILLCRRCGLRWLNPYVPPSEYLSFYDNDYYQSTLCNLSYQEEKQELTLCYTKNAKHFRSLGIKNRLLDIGCGTGEFLMRALQVGVIGEGVEPSEYAATQARNTGISVTQGTLSDLVASKKVYTAAHCSHVLEHVSDAHGFLNELRLLLEPNAPVYIEVPMQFDSLLDRISLLRRTKPVYSDFSIHHHYFFTPRALTKLLEDHGFSIQSLTTFMPCRRSLRKDSLRKWLLQSLLWLADRTFQRGDVISVWARREK